MQLLTIDELKPYYYPIKLNTYTQPLFHISLTYNKYKSHIDDWDIYNEVLPCIYLGRIPENNNFPDKTKLIISLVTYGELAEVDFDYATLEKHGIRHLFINMEDFDSAVSTKSIINAIKTIEFYQEVNETADIMDFLTNLIIYIHCKAGRSRSGMLVVIYFVYRKLKIFNVKDITDESLESELLSAIGTLQISRKQVDIGRDKLNTAKTILFELLQNKIQNQDKNQILNDPITYLTSLEYKNNICQFPSFKNICIYLAKLRNTQNRNTYLQTFLSQILYANNETDVKKWTKFTMLHNFANSNPSIFKTNDKIVRDKIVDTFISEVKADLAKKFNNDQIMQLFD